MRNFKFLVSLFIGIVAMNLQAQDKKVPATTDYPAITFETNTHDFGTIHEKDVVKYTFKFKNTGTAPLLISKIKASCGCTVPSNWSKEPIMPGESSQFTVQFNSRNKPNKQHKRITITCNTKAGREYANITANVIPDPELEKARQERYKKIREQQAARRAAQAKKRAEEAKLKSAKEGALKQKVAPKKTLELNKAKPVKKEADKKVSLDTKTQKSAEKSAKKIEKNAAKAKKLSAKMAKINKQIAKNQAAIKKMKKKLAKLEKKLKKLD